MTRTSKYVGKNFNGWDVVAIGVATVQPKKAKAPYHQGYYYLVERVTSDGKCVKQVRLNSTYMCQLARGTFDIEAYADKHAKSRKATAKTNYAFLV